MRVRSVVSCGTPLFRRSSEMGSCPGGSRGWTRGRFTTLRATIYEWTTSVLLSSFLHASFLLSNGPFSTIRRLSFSSFLAGATCYCSSSSLLHFLSSVDFYSWNVGKLDDESHFVRDEVCIEEMKEREKWEEGGCTLRTNVLKHIAYQPALRARTFLEQLCTQCIHTCTSSIHTDKLFLNITIYFL